jgi:hypothetical protein
MSVSFEQALIIGRCFSAVASLFILLLLYKTARMFVSERLSLFAVFLGDFSVGLTQYAHFGTFEMYLTFLSLSLLFCLLQYMNTGKYKYFVSAAVIIGLLTAIKVSSLVLIPLPIFALIARIRTHSKHSFLETLTVHLIAILVSILLVACITIVIFILGNPFAVLDFPAFQGSLSYESSVATGSLPVFYTGTFINTVPILYQSLYVMPFLLNPIIWIIFLPAFVLLVIHSFRKKNTPYKLVLLFFLFLFVPQSVLYVKWTRYLVPSLPVVYLIIIMMIPVIKSELKVRRSMTAIGTIVATFLIVSSFFWTAALMKTVYFSTDTRVAAAKEMQQKEDNSDKVLSEVFDLGIVPFDQAFSDITLFNFYELEHDPVLQSDLPNKLAQNDLLILPSQRILKSRTQHPDVFPQGHDIYQRIVSSPEFTKIYQTPCDFWCIALYLGDPVYGVEETANVFDRPFVTIYKISTHDSEK